MSEKACIFNIQTYSIHDGPGIRTTVFFKGCPLRCRWCQNPESQSFRPELMLSPEKCTGCGKCAEVCPQGAVRMENGRPVTDRERCTACGACVSACAAEARTVCGETRTVDEVYKEVSRDILFYKASGGGVTASGGEALCQPDFVYELFRKCKEAGMTTALDTTAYGAWETLERLAEVTDLFLVDIKHIRSEEHEQLTGVPNGPVLENLKRLIKKGCAVEIRMPIVPGMNDGEDVLEETADFLLRALDPLPRVALLPYHSMGESKLARLERGEEKLGLAAPSAEHMERLCALLKARGIDARVGG